MIPRKKIQLLLCTLCILYDFGNGVRASASDVRIEFEGTSLFPTESTSTSSQTETTVQGSTLVDNIDRSTETTSPYSADITAIYSESPTIEKYTITVGSAEELSDGNDTVNSTTLSYETTTELDNCGDIPSIQRLEVSSTSTTLVVSWESVTASDECILEYRITWYLDSVLAGNRTVDSTESNYTISEIKPCQSYNISVVAVGKNGESLPATFDGDTPTAIPGAVEDLTDADVNGYFVYLTWSAPTLNPTCVLSYKISICDQNECNEIDNITSLYYNATDLSPCQEYTFTVTAVGNESSSAETSKTAKTSNVTPSAPRTLEIEPGEFSLFATWEPPQSGSTCVTSYRVTWWHTVNSTPVQDGSNSTTNTNITISGLTACKSYSIQIIAVSEPATESPTVTETAVTKESVNNPPMLAIDPPDVTKSTVSITWSIDRTMNECELKNIHTTCNFVSTTGRNISVVNGQSINDISYFGSSTNATIDITVSELSPFSFYNCTGSTENGAGNSKNSTIVTARTSEDVPSAPAMDVSSVESSEFKLIWDEPWYLPGNLIEYEIFLSWEQLSLMPSSCVHNVSSTIRNITAIEGSQREYLYTEAIAYSNFTAKIRARTNAGWGIYSDNIHFKTAADVPGVVTNITYLNKSNPEDPNILDTFLSWQLPCSLNGEIQFFRINYTGIRDLYDNVNDSKMYYVAETIEADKIFTLNFGELEAEYRYTFEIYAKVAGVSELGPSGTYNVTYPAGIPPWPQESYLDKIRLNPNNIERTSSTSWILLPLFENTNGDVKYYAIMISEFGNNTAEERRLDVRSGSWPYTISWQEAMSRNPIVTYQATPIRWDPAATNNVENYGDVRVVKFNLGENESCSELSTRSYCNGPLQPEKLYQVRMRAFTDGGYSDSQVFIIRTKAEFNLRMVIGVVFGILVFGIITTMMLLIRKGVLQTVLSNILNRSAPGSPGPDPLPRKKFELHCQELIDNPGKLSNEFQLLQTLSVDLEMSANAAELQANRKKNRYINILPYDISRVKLDVINNDPNSDYINASFIQGYSGGTEYIACQGPKEETTYDFWRMIYDYNVKIIVMVTQLVEKGKDKCYQYYPNARESFTLEDYTIRCNTQLDFVFYTQRVITLQKEDSKRTVIHLHFKEWSDHGVPDDVHSMINFCQIIRKQINEYKSLAVVHCSAGVGRTGTLIAVDILLQQIKDNKKLDVFGTVYRMRQHRMNMVQTESQYAYIYDCTKQALNNPYPPKQYKTTSVEPVYETLTKKKRELTDSNTNLVASAETLKKVSPSASSGSLDPICEVIVPQRPPYTRQLSTLSLRYSKSTSAINSSIPPNLEFARFGSHEYPIFEPAPDSPLNKVNMDMHRFLEFAKPVKIESRVIPPEDDENTDCRTHGFGLNY